MITHFSDIEFLPIINIIAQLNAIIFFAMFMVGFSIKKILQILKG